MTTRKGPEPEDKSFDVKDGDFVMSGKTGPQGNSWRCVQVAIKPQGVAVRDSKDADKKTLFFNNDEWDAFIQGVKGGEFDLKV